MEPTSGHLRRFTNCRILRDHKISREDLWVLKGKIVDPEDLFYTFQRKEDELINLEGMILAPGFIDVQINGGFGVDFTHDLAENPLGLNTVASGILKHGVTAFCPTIVTTSSKNYKKLLEILVPRKGGVHGAEVLGAHLEGPFININKKGAHNAEYISDLEQGVGSMKTMYGPLIKNIKMVTIAPEKKRTDEVIQWLVDQNITVSLGHSEADVEIGEKAVLAGATMVTHMFNAMAPFHHRNPGLVGLLGSKYSSLIYYGLIADGVHTNDAALRIAQKTLPSGAILVTDAISAMGLAEGKHHLGNKEILISGNEAYLAGTSTLCGSIATMSYCVQHFYQATDCSIVDVLEAASLHPALLLGLTEKGNLNFGCDADLVVLNDDLDVLSTWIGGDLVRKN